MYLGHHWGYRRESGEMQIAVNYYRAFNDFLSRFVFGKGVHFRSPKATEAIIPDRLERIWEVDNEKIACATWDGGNKAALLATVL